MYHTLKVHAGDPARFVRIRKVQLMATSFGPVIDELRSHPAPESYLDYLRFKLRQTATEIAKPASLYISQKI
jgi:hypothetical protein